MTAERVDSPPGAVAASDFFGVLVHVLDTAEALSLCRGWLRAEAGVKRLFFLNAHCFNVVKQDAAYEAAIRRADLVLNDGVGLALASRLAGVRFKENMNGTDFIPKLIGEAGAQDAPVFLLGAAPRVAQGAAREFERLHPSVRIVGARDGYFGPAEEAGVVDEINRSGATLLIVGMGVPRQECWIDRIAPQLDHVRVAVAGGAILDFTARQFRRAPRWAQRLGVEWVFRLAQEPGRLLKRYTLGTAAFAFRVLRCRIAGGRRRPADSAPGARHEGG